MNDMKPWKLLLYLLYLLACNLLLGAAIYAIYIARGHSQSDALQEAAMYFIGNVIVFWLVFLLFLGRKNKPN